MSKKNKGLGKFIIGTIIGGAAGLLFAPKKGSETRKDLKTKFDEVLEKVKQIDKEEVKLELEAKIHEIKSSLESLSKEEVFTVAKEKSEELLVKAENLLDYTIKNGTPFLEKAVAEIREVVKDTTEDIMKKFNEQQK